ncbi:MAG: DUF1489 family protein [Roseibium album]|uniref:DUF1489 family protein n=1 Tax=Roseibium album TaxID=311410 RepID=A0A0M7AER8_9HYPH|nr:DUF1489 family protein [Roseibium album]MBG6147939.1 hypothetical protein [Labrenzia sp. EL_142]MBG6158429.1 hypothetical protein [Labrenzia sp. EL_162]MBG6165794.1 hypothetical protein [Labrenzia sp. EL_195]MBG6178231.1 hypothetical protein [Labrenzia sp. EL_132]MBG6196558.1 hypothetical protein [Labrenzia sp. EL_159]MBG6202604.1 hypothetical protein [Labrenzia sp. EL_13]MBG6211085.1 hypothetical protein [Labrenzia sp. EL_126]MBG6232855.1 hypothetical protein [Labrenzia sp. EL_208]MCR9
MTLHLVKLCVGADSAESLQASIDFRIEQARLAGLEEVTTHTTRMVPTRKDDLLEGGSLYWVIKGKIQVRQHLIDIRPFTDDAGIKRCDLVLEPRLILTRYQPRRPFQGWRYLKADDAPADMRLAAETKAMSDAMRQDLTELCLL